MLFRSDCICSPSPLTRSPKEALPLSNDVRNAACSSCPVVFRSLGLVRSESIRMRRLICRDSSLAFSRIASTTLILSVSLMYAVSCACLNAAAGLVNIQRTPQHEATHRSDADFAVRIALWAEVMATRGHQMVRDRVITEAQRAEALAAEPRVRVAVLPVAYEVWASRRK